MGGWILINVFLFGLSCGWFFHKWAYYKLKKEQ